MVKFTAKIETNMKAKYAKYLKLSLNITSEYLWRKDFSLKKYMNKLNEI